MISSPFMSLIKVGILLCVVYVGFFVYYLNSWNTTNTYTPIARYDSEYSVKTPTHVAMNRLKNKQRGKNNHEEMYEWDQYGKSDVFFSVAKKDVCKQFPESPACSFVRERDNSA